MAWGPILEAASAIACSVAFELVAFELVDLLSLLSGPWSGEQSIRLTGSRSLLLEGLDR